MYPLIGETNNIPIASYYVFNLLAVLAGFIVLSVFTKNFNASKRGRIFIFGILIFIPFIAGARAGHIFESIVTGVPECITKTIFFGPYSLIWGLIVSAILAVPLAHLLKIDLPETADLFALSISIGGVFARIACLLNGCCFGAAAPPNFAFSVFYPYGSRAWELFSGGPVYPVQIFESLAWLFIFIFLLIRNKTKSFTGELFILMGFMYGCFRFLLEFLRYHETPGFPSIAQLLSLIIAAITSIVWFLKKRHK
jgi:phosphatidylglycerol:prolipoprotein diacylglycerol transferase